MHEHGHGHGRTRTRLLQVDGSGDPDEVMRRIQEAIAGIPEQPAGDDGDDGDDDRTVFLGQMTLDRPWKNAIEAHGLHLALDQIDGVTTSFMGVMESNPLDQHAASGLCAFAAFSIRAHTTSEAQILVETAVTDSVPAPFGITTLWFTPVVRKGED